MRQLTVLHKVTDVESHASLSDSLPISRSGHCACIVVSVSSATCISVVVTRSRGVRRTGCDRGV